MSTAVAVERGLLLKRVQHRSATAYARGFLDVQDGSTTSIRVRSYDAILPETPDVVHRSTHAYIETKEPTRPPNSLTRTFQTRKGRVIAEAVTVDFVPRQEASARIAAHDRWFRQHHQ